ncbi:M23 family metallopeptidase [Chloroflexota bacterium]
MNTHRLDAYKLHIVERLCLERRLYLKRSRVFTIILIFAILLVVPLSGCAEYSESCPSYETVSLSEADTYVNNTELPFRFPLDNFHAGLYGARFAEYGTGSAEKCHAAEDYLRAPGTPVFAIADGVVSFCGPMGGYGWLIIIDHPQANLYSLYGHLSPSRWYIESGVFVEKGQLIAYLGDSDENGGSSKQPLTPHLHFGIRAGQRADYSSMGEWRWQAGWIKYCPQDLGWLQPSLIIVNQDIPPGGFSKQASVFLSIWWNELLLSGFLLIGATFAFMVIIRRRKPILLVLNIGFLALVTWFTFSKELKVSYVLLAICIMLVLIETFKLFRRRTQS